LSSSWQALKNTAGATDEQIASTEDWITAQGKALGVADDDLRPALAKLSAATHDVGKAQELAALSMDAAAGSGKSLEAVSKAVANAANGNVAGLAKLGISTKNAEGDTISFEQAQKRLAATFKGQAEKNANTLSGKMARLKLILGEAGEEIGAKLIPVVTKMADWFINKALPSIEAFGTYLKIVLPPIFEKIKAVIAQFTGDGSGKLSKFIEDVKQIWNDGVTIVTKLWEMFGKNIVQFLTSTVKNLFQILKGAFKIIRGIFKVFSSLLKGDWKGAWKGIQMILSGAKDIIMGLVKQLGNLLRFAFKNIGVALKAIFANIWDGIKNIARNGAEWLVDQIRAIPGRLADLGRAFLNAGKGLIGALLNGLGNVGSFVGGFAQDIWNGVKGAVNAGIDALNNLLEFDFKVHGIGFTVNAPDIPHLAKGTRSFGGGLAVVGEEGPELVNLPRGSGVTPHGQSMGALRSLDAGGVTINVYGALDPVAVGRQIEQTLVKYQRATGRKVQFG
jgi:hypothetical protein